MIQTEVTGYVNYYNAQKSKYETSVDTYNADELKWLSSPGTNTRPSLDKIESDPGVVENYDAFYMEVDDFSYPQRSTVVTPYSGKGGWGFLTAGTLQVGSGEKSWGMLGQGDGNTNAIS